MSTEPPGDEWPVWIPPTEGSELIRTGYGGIARYVVPGLIEHFSDSLPPWVRTLVKKPDMSESQVDQAALAHLWDRFVELDIAYAPPKWNPTDGQPIRDPRWMLGANGWGTCTDLAVMFAGACINAGLDTLLVMLRGASSGHVGLAIRLGGRRRAAGGEPHGTRGSAGVYRVTDRERFLSNDNFILVDLTAGTAGAVDRSLNHASAQLADAIRSNRYDDIHLVDIEIRQKWVQPPDTPWPDLPAQASALLAKIAPSPPSAIHVDARAAVAQQVAGMSGKVVIAGPPGVGKSSIARQAALRAGRGFGWFVNASSKDSLAAALARHELLERGEDRATYDGEDRNSLAREARSRLGNVAGRWVVVADNANAGRQPISEQLPDPQGKQLLIVTSTIEDPAAWPGYHVVRVLPLTPDEMAIAASRIGLPAPLAEACAGTPLLLDAFAKVWLINDKVLGHPSLRRVNTPAEGAELLWAIVSREWPALVPAGRAAALLPADRIELVCLDDQTRAQLANLVGAGLLSFLDDQTLTMHRLFGAAIRNATAPAALTAMLTSLLSRQAVVTSFLRNADPEVMTLLRDLTDHTSGTALWGLATVEEMFDEKASEAAFLEAVDLLDEHHPQERNMLADALHALARKANREANSLPEDGYAARATADKLIDEAIALIERALRVRDPADIVGLAKHNAMLALLRQRLAKRLPKGPQKLAALETVAAALDESFDQRLKILGESDLLVDRAYFNRAGIRIELAKADPEGRAGHLSEAARVYRSTTAFRRANYTAPNPLIAASVAGIATWAFYDVLFGECSEPEVVLLDGLEAAAESLEMRVSLGKPDDIRKSAALVAKLGALAHARHRGSSKNLFAETAEELEDLELPASE